MLRSLKLLLPALLPSWGFFDVIAPSPRIQFQLLDEQSRPLSEWQEFRPRPTHVSALCMLRRLLWNAPWNETLFLVSCAERIAEHDSVHGEDEILMRILRDWRNGALSGPIATRNLRFRLLFVHRQQRVLMQEVRFISRIAATSDASS